MKMILAIVKDESVEKMVAALTAVDFRVTRVASTGGFFRSGNTTLMLGLEDDKVESAIGVIRQQCDANAGKQKNATLFVIPVSHFEQI